MGSASNAWARIAKKLAIPRGGSKSDKRAKYEAMSTNTSPKRKRGDEGEEVKKEKFKVRKEEMVVVEEMKMRKEEEVVVEEMKVKEEEEEGPVKKRARVRPRIKKEAIDGSREEEEDTYRLSSVSAFQRRATVIDF